MRDTPVPTHLHSIEATAVDLERYPLGLDTSLDQYETQALLGLKSHRTLATMRREGRGPRYFRIGPRPKYLLRDIIAWQRARLCTSTLEESFDRSAEGRSKDSQR